MPCSTLALCTVHCASQFVVVYLFTLGQHHARLVTRGPGGKSSRNAAQQCMIRMIDRESGGSQRGGGARRPRTKRPASSLPCEIRLGSIYASESSSTMRPPLNRARPVWGKVKICCMCVCVCVISRRPPAWQRSTLPGWRVLNQ